LPKQFLIFQQFLLKKVVMPAKNALETATVQNDRKGGPTGLFF
jgi:hypothetical protein